MKSIFNKLMMIALVLFWTSCSDSENPNPENTGVFNEGVFVLNEGGYRAINASLSFYNTQNETVTNDIYYNYTGLDLGDVLQSGHLVDDKLYLVVNNSNKVVALDFKDSLTVSYSVTGLVQPRYMTTANGNGYISEWVGYGVKGQVSVIDIQSGAVSSTVEVGYQPEGVVISGDQLFVAGNSTGNVYVISLDTEELVDSIAVGAGPGEIVTDADGDLWVACAGSYDAEYNAQNDGAIYELDPSTLEVKKHFELGANASGKVAMNASGSILYYYVGASIYALDVAATELPQAALVEEENSFGFYGIGVGPDGVIYAGDALDFTQNGLVYRYQADGAALGSFGVGLLPNGFIFR